MSAEVVARLGAAAAADSVALAAAADAAAEALTCHRDALAILAAGWRSETGSSATDLLRSQCSEAAGIVTALHRAAAGARCLDEEWGAGPGGCDDARSPEVQIRERPDDLGYSGPDGAPVSPLGEPVLQPAAAAPPATPAPAWPVPPPQNWPAGGGGSGGGTALPDLGGTLVDLVAQIAQTLGSYADAPGDVPVDGVTADALPPAEPASGSHGHEHRIEQAVPGASAVPPGAAAVGAGQPPPVAPELLAAERQPTGPALVAPEPPPDQNPAPTDAIPIEPEPAAPPAPPVPSPASADATPCEIAADEMAKVGE